MFGKAFTGQSQPSQETSPETPSRAWNNFNFGAYRSPAALLADSTTSSPLGPTFLDKCDENTSTIATCDNRSMTRPPPRRQPKKRYSFLMSEQDTFKATSRPSLLDLDEDEPLDVTTAGLDKSASRPPHVTSSSLMSLDTNGSINRTPARQSVPSSRLSESVYFDAEEAPGIENSLITIEKELMTDEFQDQFQREMDGEPSLIAVSEESQDDSTMILEETESDTEDDDDMDEDIILVMCDFKSRFAASFMGPLDPNRRLPCTQATAKDVKKFKAVASSLLCYKESEETYRNMMFRLERMIKLEQTAAFRAQRQPFTATQLAKNMRTFLQGIAVGRVQTGEIKQFVEHETDWAVWLYEACKAGIVHVKHGDCRCSPHWFL